MEKLIISSCALTISLSLLMHYMNTQMGLIIRNWIGTEVIYQAAEIEDDSVLIPNLFIGTILVLWVLTLGVNGLFFMAKDISWHLSMPKIMASIVIILWGGYPVKSWLKDFLLYYKKILQARRSIRFELKTLKLALDLEDESSVRTWIDKHNKKWRAAHVLNEFFSHEDNATQINKTSLANKHYFDFVTGKYHLHDFLQAEKKVNVKPSGKKMKI